MKVKISHGNQKGFVKYNKETKEVSIDFPNESLASDIEEYLDTKRVFRIPESQKIDDFREDLVSPLDNETYFELAMCALWAETGVWVDW